MDMYEYKAPTVVVQSNLLSPKLSVQYAKQGYEAERSRCYAANESGERQTESKAIAEMGQKYMDMERGKDNMKPFC